MQKLGSDWLWIALGVGTLLVVDNINKNGIIAPLTGSNNRLFKTTTGENASYKNWFSTTFPLNLINGSMWR